MDGIQPVWDIGTSHTRIEHDDCMVFLENPAQTDEISKYNGMGAQIAWAIRFIDLNEGHDPFAPDGHVLELIWPEFGIVVGYDENVVCHSIVNPTMLKEEIQVGPFHGIVIPRFPTMDNDDKGSFLGIMGMDVLKGQTWTMLTEFLIRGNGVGR